MSAANSFSASLEKFRFSKASTNAPTLTSGFPPQKLSAGLVQTKHDASEEEKIKEEDELKDEGIKSSLPLTPMRLRPRSTKPTIITSEKSILGEKRKRDEPQISDPTTEKTFKGKAKGKPKVESFEMGKKKKPKTKKKTMSKKELQDPSRYADMKMIPDRLAMGLNILFCGINPGIQSSEKGFPYAHGTNHFYRCLHFSGLTPRSQASNQPHPPSDCEHFREWYGYGFTDLVRRPSVGGDEISNQEMRDGAPILLEKLATWRPRILCLVGMSIYKEFLNYFRNMGEAESVLGKSTEPIKAGLQKMRIVLPVVDDSSLPSNFSSSDTNISLPDETLIFVLPSTSARVAQYQLQDKICFCQSLAELSNSTGTEWFNNKVEKECSRKLIAKQWLLKKE